MKKLKFAKTVLSAALLPTISVASVGALLAAPETSPRDNWSLEALGPDVPKPEWKPAPVRHPLKTQFKSVPVEGEPLVFVKEQTPRAVLVLSQDANSSAKAAAEVLQQAFEQMSGVELPIHTENEVQQQQSTFIADGKSYESLLSIGDTQLAKAAQINADGLKADGYRLQTQGKVLFLVGQDKEPFADTSGRALPESGPTITRYLQANGTRNGAYALLERHFGYRWLWPEEAGGTVYPKQSTLTLQPINESDEPVMAARGIRNYYPEHRVNAYGRRQQQSVLPLFPRSYSSFLKKSENSGKWFQAMRLGTSVEYNVGHSFTNYWDEYGETHREWFALQADGTRDQTRWYNNRSQARLDVTNSELIQHIADAAIAAFDADPELSSVSIAPNDGSYPSFCLCEVCRRLDPPQGEQISFSIVNKEGEASRINYPSLSDRYVTFYSKVADKVAEKHPDKLLGAYAYSVYSSPPHYAKLSPNVFISYVGLSYFNEAQRQRDKQSWDLWAAAGGQMLLRPNALLGLYGIPANFARKLSEDVKHAYQTGMIGTDFDALEHDWAGRGLNYYVLAKLLWDPSLDVDEIIKDYCDSGFGSASAQIQKYFAELETLTNEIAEHTGDTARTEDGINKLAVATSLRLMLRAYTPERIEQLQAILDEARKQTDEKEVLQRIDFLSQGLRYARVETNALRANFHGKNNTERVKHALAERKRVLEDIYDNHFYAQSIFSTLYRTTSLWRPYGLDGLGGELKD